MHLKIHLWMMIITVALYSCESREYTSETGSLLKRSEARQLFDLRDGKWHSPILDDNGVLDPRASIIKVKLSKGNLVSYRMLDGSAIIDSIGTATRGGFKYIAKDLNNNVFYSCETIGDYFQIVQDGGCLSDDVISTTGYCLDKNVKSTELIMSYAEPPGCEFRIDHMFYFNEETQDHISFDAVYDTTLKVVSVKFDLPDLEEFKVQVTGWLVQDGRTLISQGNIVSYSYLCY